MSRGQARLHPPVTRSVVAMLAAIWLGPSILPPLLEANTLAAISRSHDAAGRTLVTVVCTEPITSGSYRTFPLRNPPREVVALEGITTSVEPGELWIGDGRVKRVRLIHHPDRQPPELLLAFDLASENSRIVEILHQTDRLVILLGNAFSPTPQPTAPSPTPVPATETPPPPDPSLTPTFEPSPTPTSTSTATRTPSPTATSPRPVKSAVTPTPAAPSGPGSLATGGAIPTVPAPAGDGSKVEMINVTSRGDGTTLLRISAGGTLASGCARHMEVAGDEPRIVVTMRGVSAPDLPRTLTFDDPNLSRIRLIHDAETSDGELHMVLQPTGPGVTIREMRQLGPHLVVVLNPPAPPAGK